MGYSTLHEAETAIQKFDGLDVGQGSRLKVALALEKQKPTFSDPEPTVHAVNGITDSAERYLVISWCVNIFELHIINFSRATRNENICMLKLC